MEKEAGEKWGFIGPDGKMVIEAQFGGPSSFHEGLAVAQVGEKFSTQYGYIDKTGAHAIKPQFHLAWRFSEGLARVETNATLSKVSGLVQEPATMAFIDKSGTIAFRVRDGRSAGVFSEGLVNVQTNDRVRGDTETWGYVDRAGEWAIRPRFQRAEPFSHGLARVFIDYKFAYIDKTGKYVWGPDSGNEALAARLRKQTSAEDYRKSQEELLRLARLISPGASPLARELLQSGDVKEALLGNVPKEALLDLARKGQRSALQLRNF